MDNGTINRVDVPSELKPNEENVEITLDALSPKMTPDEFRVAVESQMSRATTYAEGLKIKTRQALLYKYWKGDQVDKAALRDDLEKSVENVIFQNLETFIPIASGRVPELSVTPGFKNEQTRAYALDVKRVEQTEWEVYQKMQALVETGIRNHQMNLVAVYQLGYDPETKEFWTKEIPATQLVISKDKKFVARYIKDQTLGEVLDRFPDKQEEILKKLGYSSVVTTELRASPAEYIEAWTNEVVGWKMQELVLGVENNPHFDYTGTKFVIGSKPVIDQTTGMPVLNPTTGQPLTEPVEAVVKFNHFKKPRMPFLFLNYWTRGIEVFDDTTLLEQAIGPQDWINKRKRQIGMNADSTNGHWVSSGDYISKEEFDKIEGNVDEKIWLESGKPMDGFHKATSEALPDYIYNDLLDSRGTVDRLMGIEQATRGESTNNKTLGQDVLARQQNYGRMDGYVRAIERLAQDWYEYLYHMYLVYKNDESTIAIPEDDDFESDNVLFSRDSIPLIHLKNGDLIPVPLVLRVKQGSTLPQDDVFEYNKAQQNRDRYAPIDYFKKIGEPNPRELAKNALIQAMDPTFFFKDDPDVQMLMAKKAEEAQLAAQASAEAEARKTNTTISVAQINAESKKQNAAPAGDQNFDPNAKEDIPGTEVDNEETSQGVANAMRDMIQKGEVTLPEGLIPAQA